MPPPSAPPRQAGCGPCQLQLSCVSSHITAEQPGTRIPAIWPLSPHSTARGGAPETEMTGRKRPRAPRPRPQRAREKAEAGRPLPPGKHCPSRNLPGLQKDSGTLPKQHYLKTSPGESEQSCTEIPALVKHSGRQMPAGAFVWSRCINCIYFPNAATCPSAFQKILAAWGEKNNNSLSAFSLAVISQTIFLLPLAQQETIFYKPLSHSTLLRHSFP